MCGQKISTESIEHNKAFINKYNLLLSSSAFFTYISRLQYVCLNSGVTEGLCLHIQTRIYGSQEGW